MSQTAAAFDGPRDQTLATPWRWVRAIEAAIGRPLDLDVCAAKETAKAPRFYTEEDDGLASPWEGLCFCNPPFNSIPRWVGRGIDLWEGKLTGAPGPARSFEGVIYVVPVRSELRWFQALRHLERKGGAVLAFPPMRINYEGAKSDSAPFASCVWGVGAGLDGLRQLEGPPTADLFELPL